MYDNLVKRLKYAADIASLTHPTWTVLMTEAADAIEELSKENESLGKDLTSAVEMLKKKRKPKWIPSSERLPDYDEEVLVADFCSLGWCMHVWYRTHDGKGTDYWEAEDGHFVGINYAEYWMPLPEPPKEKDDGN